jgi:hypothetical protein
LYFRAGGPLLLDLIHHPLTLLSLQTSPQTIMAAKQLKVFTLEEVAQVSPCSLSRLSRLKLTLACVSTTSRMTL